MNASSPLGGSYRVLGGPTVLFDFAGLRILSDPTFDAPSDYGLLRKTEPPTLSADALGAIDLVLLSHDDHRDSLDVAGREVALAAPRVLSTPPAAQRLGDNAVALAAWQSTRVGELVVTAVPAIHGPADGERDARGFVNCEVIGFVLEAGGARLYVSGDNTSLEVVRQVRERFGEFDAAILHGGRASVPAKFNGRPLSMTGAQAAEAARILGVRRAVVAHQTQWAHFTEGPQQTLEAFEAAGLGAVLDPAALGEVGEWL